MQDELKLYAHAENEFEAEADEYPDELEDGFDDDEEEEEVSVIVSSTPVIAELLPPPASATARTTSQEGPSQKGCGKEDRCPGSSC